MQAYAKARAIQQTHADKIAPQISALSNDRSRYDNPEVRVRLAMDDLPAAVDNGAEEVHITGVAMAFFDSQRALVCGSAVTPLLEGDCERVLTIASLFAESSLRSLVAK